MEKPVLHPDQHPWMQIETPPTRAQIGVSFRHLGCYGYIQHAIWPHKRGRVEILRDFEGLLLPGEMLLVLGRTGSGCSTFLKALSGDTAGFKITDDSSLNYQGTPYDKFHRDFTGERIYVAELDVHFPELTLGQTLEFALSVRKENDLSATQVAQLYGLDNSLDTQVGDTLSRGLSGGEKRRVSIAEAYIGGAQLSCWDNSTRGLDSRTASRLVGLLRNITLSHKSTIAMSLYQMSEAMYQNFDNVILLYEGLQIYFGPAASAADYFHRMGFARPERSTTADFLTSLTTPEQRIIRSGYEDRVPRGAEEFARAWKYSEEARVLRHQMDKFDSAFPVVMETPAGDLEQVAARGRLTSASNTFALSIVQQTWACLKRAWLRFKKTLAVEISGLVANAILGLIIGSVFYNMDETSGNVQRRTVLLFFALIINAFVPAAEVNKMWAQRPIVEKQFRYAFYHPFTERLASMMCDMPAKILVCFAIHLPIYFMANLRRETTAFFIYWLFMLVNMITMSMLFRMIGSISRTHMQTMVPIMIAILLCVLYTGFILPPDYMHPWLGWFRFINPLAYTYQSLVINEMRNRLFSCPPSMMIPAGDYYRDVPSSQRLCASVGGRLGESGVSGSLYIALRHASHEGQLWRNLGILFGMMILFMIVHLVASEYIGAQPSKGEVLTFSRRSQVKVYLNKQPNDGTDIQLANISNASDQEDIAPKSNFQKHRANMPGAESGYQTAQAGCFHWAGIGCEVKTKGGKRQILSGVNGWVEQGTLTALMGVTGAGKTTLLNVLADRVSTGTRSGEFYVEGQSRDESFQRKVGYVQQEDIHLGTSTVREALQFSALLRRPESISTEEKLAYVETVLDMLDMQRYADAFIGVPGVGLNIEQRKRLTIAVEMVAKPELLIFLDEPTSGLDSETAWSICKLLRKLVSNGHTILCTIHQPSSQILNMFDRILLLGNTGTPVYFGDVGPDAGTLVHYFERNGARPCNSGDNPAEWMLEVTENTSSRFIHESNCLEVLPTWAERWKRSPENAAALHRLETLTLEKEITTTPQAVQGEFAVPRWTQMLHVSKRIFRDQCRDPSYLMSKLLLPVLMALINGISFYKTPSDIQGTTNLLFSIFLITQMFTCINRVTIPHFFTGRALFEARERHSKTYHWSVFIGANVLVEFFWQTLVSAPVFVSWYYPIGLMANGDASLSTAERGGASFVLIWLFILWVSTISQAFSALFDHVDMAMDISVLFYWLVLVFCGVLATPDQLPKFWKFMYHVSPLTYFLEGLTASGLYNARVSCSSVEELHLPLATVSGASNCGEYLSPLAASTGGQILNPSSDGVCRFCPLSEMNSLLEMFGMTVNLWRDVGLMFVYVGFNVVMTFGVYWLIRVSKK